MTLSCHGCLSRATGAPLVSHGCVTLVCHGCDTGVSLVCHGCDTGTLPLCYLAGGCYTLATGCHGRDPT